jgi:hypothetical protein
VVQLFLNRTFIPIKPIASTRVTPLPTMIGTAGFKKP